MAVVLNKYVSYYNFMNFESKVYDSIGKNVRKYRLEKGISQEKLSEMLDANSKFIGHVERVERYVSLKKLIQIAKILNVTVADLVEINN